MLVLKYGRQSQKEQAVLILMSADLALLVPLKTGALLFAEIWKYCSKIKGISLLNKYFESSFNQHARRVSCYLSLSAFLNSLSPKQQGEVLAQNRGAFELGDGHLKELTESYQKLRQQFQASVFHFAILANFE